MNKFHKITLFLLLTLFFVVPVQAQEKTFHWERFDVEITLLPTGDLRVVEQQTIDFTSGMFSYGYGEIPTGVNGGNDGITDLSVREGDIRYQEAYGGPYTYQIYTDDDDQVGIQWLFEPTRGPHTYTFAYTARGAIIKNVDGPGGGDQVFWMAIPADRDAPIERSRVTLRLPQDLAPQLNADTGEPLVAGYINGREDGRVEVNISDGGQTISFSNPVVLDPGDRFEVRVQFPSDVYNMPMPAWQAAKVQADGWGQVLVWLSLAIAVAGPLIIFLLWYFTGRDPDPGLVENYLTGPPDNLSAGLLGTLVDEYAEFRDVMGAVFDLAQRGFLQIREVKESQIPINDDSSEEVKSLLAELEAAGQAWDETIADGTHRIHIGKDDYLLTLKNRDWRNLHPFEQQILQDLFEGEDSRLLSELKYEFAYKLSDIQQHMYTALMKRHMFTRSPDEVRRTYFIAGRIIVAAAIVLGIVAIPWGMSFFVSSQWALILPPLALLVTAGAVLLFARYMPAKTLRGAEIAARGEAFKKYLTEVEQHTDLSQSGDLFGRYLPYAVAFGMQDEWIGRFAAVPDPPLIPTWYVPALPLTNRTVDPSAAGISDLSTMMNKANTILRSVPPSSSSSSSGFSSASFSSGGGARGFG